MTMQPAYRLPPPFEHVPVVLGPLSADPASLAQLTDGLWADEQTVVFRNDLLTVAVHGVERVELDVLDGTHPDFVTAILHGHVVRRLFLHSGVFSMHASLLRFDRGATTRVVAVAGHSGSGKSTTISHAARSAGAHILVDDVLPLTTAGDAVIAHPYPRPVHLLPDAAYRLGLLEGGDAEAVATGLGKVMRHLASPSDAIKLDHIVALDRAEGDVTEPLTVRAVRGAERLRVIVRHSNVTGIASLGGRGDAYVTWATDVATRVPMTAITRRSGDDTLDDVVDCIARIRSGMS